jgi:hypothetical protein
MADVALKAGIDWKKTVLLRDLSFVLSEIMGHVAVGNFHSLRFDIASMNRILEEISTLDGADQKKKFDLVKHNLERGLRSAELELSGYEGFVSEHKVIDEDMKKALAALRAGIADLKKKLDALNAEGRPQ